MLDERFLDYYYLTYHLEIKNAIKAELLKIQNNQCAICEVDRIEYLKFAFGKQDFVLDHSHTTDIIRGMTCIYCNSLLARIEKLDVNKLESYYTINNNHKIIKIKSEKMLHYINVSNPVYILVEKYRNCDFIYPTDTDDFNKDLLNPESY